MSWQYLVLSFGLTLVIEGITPFLIPRRYRLFLLRMLHNSDRSLRMIGLISMLLGVVIIVLMRQIYNL